MSSSPESFGRLAGKVAITIGSSSSIGRAISLAYPREGAKIICADLTLIARGEIEKETLIAIHELVQSKGGEAISVKTDVSSGEDMERLVRTAAEKFGRLDVTPKLLLNPLRTRRFRTVNNAATMIPGPTIHETPDEIWVKYLDCRRALRLPRVQAPDGADAKARTPIEWG